MNLFLFISIFFILTFLLGGLLEKIRVPWVFAALFLGVLLAIYNPFFQITSSATFDFLAQLGMFFLLFVVGLEINLAEMRKKGGFMFRATFFIIFLEAIFGSILVYFVFGYGWVISLLVALSFATVGEAILIPILDEFNIVNTRLGQTIIGIGTIDNIVEITALIFTIFLIGSGSSGNIFFILGSLAALFLLTFGLSKLKNIGGHFAFLKIESLFLFTLFIFFLFIGIGVYAEAAPLAALLAGIALRTFLPKERLKTIESEIKTMAYGFFAPIFFLWVGATMDISYLVSFPLLILLVVLVSKGSKLLGSYIVARKELGTKQSILLGVGLSVRFSMSIIIVKILLDNNLIGIDLYSVIMASTIAFNFIVPLLFSNLLVKWNIARA